MQLICPICLICRKYARHRESMTTQVAALAIFVSSNLCTPTLP